MTYALDGHIGTVSNGGRTITNLRFVDDIDATAGYEQKLANIVKHLNKTSSDYGMEINAEKTKLMTSNSNAYKNGYSSMGKVLETVDNFKYLGATLSDEGSKSEILSRIAQTSATMARLKPMWKNNTILKKKTVACTCHSLNFYESQMAKKPAKVETDCAIIVRSAPTTIDGYGIGEVRW